jgi:hypothetical protein
MTGFVIFVIVVAALGLLVLFLVFPAVRRHPDRAIFDGKCIAHRGLHGGAENVPENSLQAFEIAAEKGYPIETDIHVTKDGRVAVFHDDDLKRMCGDERKPEELTLDELKDYVSDIGSLKPPKGKCMLKDGTILTLENEQYGLRKGDTKGVDGARAICAEHTAGEFGNAK